jgi:hypothetical protein
MMGSNESIFYLHRHEQVSESKELDICAEFKKEEEFSFGKPKEKQIPRILDNLRQRKYTSQSAPEKSKTEDNDSIEILKSENVFMNKKIEHQQYDESNDDFLSKCENFEGHNINNEIHHLDLEENMEILGNSQEKRIEDSSPYFHNQVK